jgi:dipeptidyl aminopeptidase/acylaminoacyl peptidase
MGTRIWIWLAAVAFVAPAGLPTAAADATVAGANGKIAFVRQGQIFVTDGVSTTQLTTDGRNTRPKWSPDGLRIAYVHQTLTGSRDIWLMSADGTDKIQFTSRGSVGQPAWSPDGSQIAFGGHVRSSFGPTHALFAKDAVAPFAPAALMRGYLTRRACREDETPADSHAIFGGAYLAWSPDGRHIALTAGTDDPCAGYGIVVYNRDKQKAVVVIGSGHEVSGFDRWTALQYGPDGALGFAQIVDNTGGDPEPSRIVYPFHIGDRHYNVLPGEPGDTGFAPSPDGAEFAVVNASGGTGPVIYVQRLDGGGRHAVADGRQPDWQSLPSG